MDRKAEAVRLPISSVVHAKSPYSCRGFALLELLCVLAIIGLLAAVLLPNLPYATSRVKLEGFAVQTAALLKEDRNAAVARRVTITTRVEANTRSIKSGASGRTIRIPSDVVMEAALASRCANHVAGKSIDFFPSGMSCGGTVFLSRPGIALEIRVNWFTGTVEIVPRKSV
jgi:general secretion pathway protein H